MFLACRVPYKGRSYHSKKWLPYLMYFIICAFFECDHSSLLNYGHVHASTFTWIWQPRSLYDGWHGAENGSVLGGEPYMASLSTIPSCSTYTFFLVRLTSHLPNQVCALHSFLSCYLFTYYTSLLSWSTSSYNPFFPKLLCFTIRKIRTAAQFFNNAVINGLKPLHKTDVNGDKIAKKT